jgi:hypothetical protein
MADRINEQELPLDTGRIIGFDLVRAVEAASLGGFKWLGCGDKIAADEAATDALRGMLNLIDMQGLWDRHRRGSILPSTRSMGRG